MIDRKGTFSIVARLSIIKISLISFFNERSEKPILKTSLTSLSAMIENFNPPPPKKA